MSSCGLGLKLARVGKSLGNVVPERQFPNLSWKCNPGIKVCREGNPGLFPKKVLSQGIHELGVGLSNIPPGSHSWNCLRVKHGSHINGMDV